VSAIAMLAAAATGSNKVDLGKEERVPM